MLSESSGLFVNQHLTLIYEVENLLGRAYRPSGIIDTRCYRGAQVSSLIQINGVNLSLSASGTLSRNDKKQASKELLSVFRAAVCAHQGFIAEHFLLGNEYHKKLRVATAVGKKDAVQDLVKKLDGLHLEALKKAWQFSVQHLSTYFMLTHKSPILPRFCLKASVPKANDVTSEKAIIDIFRDDGSRSKKSVSISENTGFSDAASKGKYYLENNIPEAVCRRGYKNPRLNPRNAADYKQPIVFQPRYWGEDKEWVKCWDVDTIAPSHPNTCYKSTLIVPMTLVNNPMSEEFYQNTGVGKAVKVDRLIYGFLCLDHPNRGYFNDTDINVGYIFADLLSIYLITSDALVARSAVYEDAKKFNREA